MTARARAPSPTPSPIPTIRLISAPAEPASASLDAEAGHSFLAADTSAASGWSAESSWALPSPIAPKPESRKRAVVPKKSKLGLLGSSREKPRASSSSRKDDFSDVARRVGASATGGFDIYVDQAADAELGSLLLVKKKKSRAALDGMKWGTLGETTNVPQAQKAGKAKDKGLLKVKTDEKDKWWSIGRGRRDSKEKVAKENARAKSPQPVDAPARFGSLDSGSLLSPNFHVEPVKSEPAPASLSSANLLGVPNTNMGGGKGDSVAIRAMRSVRSMARLASWTQPKEEQAPPAAAATAAIESKPEEKEKDKEKDKDKDKEKDKKKKKTKPKKLVMPPPVSSASLRHSSSSFEAGALTPSPAPPAAAKGPKKKLSQSLLGLGWGAATLRLRSGSSASSVGPVAEGRHSLEPAVVLGGAARHRLASTLSGASSLRPISTASGDSAGSSGSVRWDEAGLRTVREMRRRERAGLEGDKGRKGSRESRRSAEGRRRTPVDSIFAHREEEGGGAAPPLLTLQEATLDGHDSVNDSPVSRGTLTPVKKARPRPMSEQMLGKSRPEPMKDEESGVMSVLSAATNDLAQLINYLDLEATPGTPDCSPLRPDLTSAERIARGWSAKEAPLTVRQRVLALESPVKSTKKQGGLREKVASVSSLRPYATVRAETAPTTQQQQQQQQSEQAAGAGKLIGQQIAPWAELDWETSPLKRAPPPTKRQAQGHKRTLTPAQEAEGDVVFQPLHPAKKAGKAVVRNSGKTLTHAVSSLKTSDRTAFWSNMLYALSQVTSFFVIALSFWYSSCFISNLKFSTCGFFVGLMSKNFGATQAGNGAGSDIFRLLGSAPETDAEPGEGKPESPSLARYMCVDIFLLGGSVREIEHKSLQNQPHHDNQTTIAATVNFRGELIPLRHPRYI
ncbi:hypothetical protein FIBSPDRAFT_890704 [Athelia psychrophila]|uniref:Uncharacterized protein n=1 Tax=Athelia psychrophila TaxID=1759441 RepID=A0A166KPX9_9AGAM|nr:hypothetical protein FIBSPDRAFT_890704 [Fibularhizoctonia sp. CBS 109695]